MSTSNHLTPPKACKSVPAMCVWFFHDHRLGHLKQLQGLAARMEALAGIHSCWLDIQDYALGLRHLFISPSYLNTLPQPAMIIGAGHKTHLSVLLAARRYRAFSALIMKPSLPLSWFDAIICPEHDKARPRDNILNTFGPLNRITPSEQPLSLESRTNNLILIGGPSRHFRFDIARLLSQIQQICQENPQTQWLLSNSPRTPVEIMSQLKELAFPNLMIKDFRDPDLASLEALLLSSDRVWLTPDSMAMIFEALTAGARVGVFEDSATPGKAGSRINQQIQAMICKQDLISFTNRESIKPEKKELNRILWETDRAAHWLLQRYASHQKQASESHA